MEKRIFRVNRLRNDSTFYLGNGTLVAKFRDVVEVDLDLKISFIRICIPSIILFYFAIFHSSFSSGVDLFPRLHVQWGV